MRNFTMVSPAIWKSRRFASLASSDARLAHLYFLTSPHQTSAGCYRLPDGYAAQDLGWDLERYAKALEAVVEARLVANDPDTSELLVLDWFRFNPPMNPKHGMGIDREISAIESERIRAAAFEALQETNSATKSKDASSPTTSPFASPELIETSAFKAAR